MLCNQLVVMLHLQCYVLLGYYVKLHLLLNVPILKVFQTLHLSFSLWIHS